MSAMTDSDRMALSRLVALALPAAALREDQRRRLFGGALRRAARAAPGAVPQTWQGSPGSEMALGPPAGHGAWAPGSDRVDDSLGEAPAPGAKEARFSGAPAVAASVPMPAVAGGLGASALPVSGAMEALESGGSLVQTVMRTPEVRAPDGPTPRFPGGMARPVSEGTAGRVPEGMVPWIHEGTAGRVPEGTVPWIPEGTAGRVPEDTVPRIPGGTVPRVPEGIVPQVPENTVPRIPEGTVPWTHESTLPRAHGNSVPWGPGGTIASTSWVVPEPDAPVSLTAPSAEQPSAAGVPMAELPHASGHRAMELSEPQVPGPIGSPAPGRLADPAPLPAATTPAPEPSTSVTPASAPAVYTVPGNTHAATSPAPVTALRGVPIPVHTVSGPPNPAAQLEERPAAFAQAPVPFPTPAAPPAATPTQPPDPANRLLEEARLRAALAQILRADALRHGLTLKER
ncbi:MAG TPA: hypothetical protein VD973_14045 [Symbiobacteriaceae bacterium]|nr:hypothetical protein [Symbiobacteriaceae bacterium]